MHRNRSVVRVVTVAVVLMLVASCSSSKGKATSPTSAASSGTTATSASAGAPQTGGTITVGEFSAPSGLDPVKLAGGGTVGGIELAALYDTIVRYNPTTKKYDPLTAQSFEPNADYSEWTLKLKSGIKFTDGTPYDAAAVKFVVDRELNEGSPGFKAQLSFFTASVTVVDPLTVQFKLKVPWSGYPYLYSSIAGMIYSPTAYQKAGSEANFNLNPVGAGAGPFKLKSYKPGEAIELERNPDYYSGQVYLDGVRFVLIIGPQPTYEAIKANTIQAGFIRDPAVDAQSKIDKYPSVEMPAVAGNIINMNSGIAVTCAGGKPESVCAGKPDGTKVPVKTATSSVTVRRAVAAAVDPKVINERAYSGKALADSAPFANFPWDPKVPGPKFDPTEAKKLVAQAKAEGWDGKIRVLASNSSVDVAWALAVSAQLTAVGMSVTTDNGKDTNAVVSQVLVAHDYDLATWAYGLLDDADSNYPQLVSTFASANPRYGYGNAEMDAAIDQLRLADTDAKRVAAYKAISEIWVRDDPALVITQIPQDLVHTPKLHDVQRSAASIVLFNKAWLEK
jgi:peptide/nickel transport system substrate-binding protein